MKNRLGTVRPFFGIIAVLLLLSGFIAFAKKYHGGKKKAYDEVTFVDGRLELRKLFENYLGKDTLTLSGDVVLLEGNAHGQTLDNANFVYIKQGTSSYSRFAYQQLFISGDLMVSLDTLHKTVIVSKPEHADDQNLAKSVFPFERHLDDTATFKINASGTQLGGVGELEITSELDPEIKRCSVRYDSKTYRLISAEIEWWKPSVESDQVDQTWLAKISYKMSDQLINIERKIGNIIKLNGDNISLQPAYKSYQLQMDF